MTYRICRHAVSRFVELQGDLINSLDEWGSSVSEKQLQHNTFSYIGSLPSSFGTHI